MKLASLHLEMWNRLQFEEIGDVLVVDEGLGLWIVAYASPYVIV